MNELPADCDVPRAALEVPMAVPLPPLNIAGGNAICRFSRPKMEFDVAIELVDGKYPDAKPLADDLEPPSASVKVFPEDMAFPIEACAFPIAVPEPRPYPTPGK